MKEQERPTSATPTLASVETESLGALAEFGTRFILLLRDSFLNDDNRKVVGERITTLLDEIKAEIKGVPTLDLRPRLDLAFADLQRLVDDLSKSQENGGTTDER